MSRSLRSIGPLGRMLWEDGTLTTACVTPALCGVLYHFGLPWLEASVPALHGIADYHPLLDLLLLLLTAYLPLMAATLLWLAEREAGVADYLRVTPMSRAGYAASRALLPAVLAALYGFAVLRLFGLASRPLLRDAGLALLAVPVAAACLAPVLAFAKRRAGGLIAARVAGLLLLTAALPYVLPVTWHPYLGLLPTYWMVRALRAAQLEYFLAAFGLSLLWLTPCCLRLRRRAR